jgi:UPF0755 protein
VSGPYRGGRDDGRGRDGGGPDSGGSGGYPQQGFGGQRYGQPEYGEQEYGEQDYGQQGRGERGRWDDEVPAYGGDPYDPPAYGGDPYDRGYGGRGAGPGQPDPRQARPQAQPGGRPGGQVPGWDDQPAGYGTVPRREQPGGGSPRSGGYPQAGPDPRAARDPRLSGPSQAQGGTDRYPRAGRDPRDSGGYRMPAGERPVGPYGYEDRQRWGDHDQFLPGFDESGGQRDYGRDDRRPVRGQPVGVGRDERYGDDSRYDGQRDDDYAGQGGRGGRNGRDGAQDERPRKRKHGPIRRLAPWIALLVILVPLVGGGLYAYRYIQDKQHPADYVGAGVGPAVLVEVKSGDTATSLAPALLADGVIKSTRAFVLAAEHSSSHAGLEAGFFSMNRHMQASLAYAYLLDPKNRVQGTVTIPEGKRLSQILALLVKGHPKITMADYQAVLKNPAQLGLPPYAGGKVEGYLFPSTYSIEPNDTALTVLKAMVARYNQHAAVFNLPKTAPAVGMTPAKIIVVASLVQAEAGRNQDMGKIAEVLYNRLNGGVPLKFDSSVFYGLGKYGTSATFAQINKPGPYNTYLNKGLPPGPIDSPGDLAIQAALHPEHGTLLYFRGCPNKVTVFSSIAVPAMSTCPAH